MGSIPQKMARMGDPPHRIKNDQICNRNDIEIDMFTIRGWVWIWEDSVGLDLGKVGG